MTVARETPPHAVAVARKVPMLPPVLATLRDQTAGTNQTPSSIRASIFPWRTAFAKLW